MRTKFKITNHDGTFFTCGDLSDENIKNLRLCDGVKSVKMVEGKIPFKVNED